MKDLEGVTRDALEQAVRADTQTRHVIAGVLIGDETCVLEAARSTPSAPIEYFPAPGTRRLALGSLGKLFTATAAVLLYDDLEQRESVIDLVPELAGTDAQHASALTGIHLGSHTSGLDGADYVGAPGYSGDALARYVQSLSRFGFLYEPGRWSSYCNAGFVLLGLVLERLTHLSFERLMESEVFANLNMRDTWVAATKREADASALPKTARRSWAPAGSTMTSTINDLLGFASWLMNDAQDSAVRIGPKQRGRVVRYLMTPVQRYPLSSTAGVTFGFHFREGRRSRVLAAPGGDYRGVIDLVIVPAEHFAYLSWFDVVDQRSTTTDELFRDVLLSQICADELSVDEGEHVPPPSLHIYSGSYERAGFITDVNVTGKGLDVDTRATHEATKSAPLERMTWYPLDSCRFSTQRTMDAQWKEDTCDMGFPDATTNGSTSPEYIAGALGRISRRRPD